MAHLTFVKLPSLSSFPSSSFPYAPKFTLAFLASSNTASKAVFSSFDYHHCNTKMFRFLCKSIYSSSSSSSDRALQLCKLYSTSSTKPISLPNGNQDSFTVRYLINQFGFSMERSLLYSPKYVKFENSDKPDSVIDFLKNQGFSHSQIRNAVSAQPCILSFNIQRTLLPKIHFRSKGFSTKDLARILAFTNTFHRSLEKCIVPSFNFIKDFVGSEKDAVLAISTGPELLRELERRVKPSIEILLGVGMSKSGIARIMRWRPRLFVYSSDKLKESVKQVQDMGIDPISSSYGLALYIITATRKSTWNKRMEAYKRWGCSEDDVLMSFKIYPCMMMISEERLNGIMSLFVHEIGWESSKVVNSYFMFTLSLKKRLIPRWSVYKELVSKGLLKKEVAMSTMFIIGEEIFLEMFVNCYKDEAPLLLKLYTEKQASKVKLASLMYPFHAVYGVLLAPCIMSSDEASNTAAKPPDQAMHWSKVYQARLLVKFVSSMPANNMVYEQENNDYDLHNVENDNDSHAAQAEV